MRRYEELIANIIEEIRNSPKKGGKADIIKLQLESECLKLMQKIKKFIDNKNIQRGKGIRYYDPEEPENEIDLQILKIEDEIIDTILEIE